MANTTGTLPKKSGDIEPAKKEDAIEQFWGAVKRIFTDLVTLDVVTVTGSIELSAGKSGHIEEIMKDLKTSKGTVKLIASSNHQIDHDAIMFIKESPTPQEAELIKLHMETVKSAQEMRSKAIESVGNMIGKLV